MGTIHKQLYPLEFDKSNATDVKLDKNDDVQIRFVDEKDITLMN